MSSDRYIIDKDGDPTPCDDLQEWREFMEQSGVRILSKSCIKGATVTTVFLGIDHRFAADGEPVLWETMVFGGRLDDFTQRYSSREKALTGHKVIAAAVESLAVLDHESGETDD